MISNIEYQRVNASPVIHLSQSGICESMCLYVTLDALH